MIASIATAVFPVCLSPIIIFCPLPTGISESIDLNQFALAHYRLSRIFLEPSLQLFFSFAVMAPFPSIGFPKPSTTLPRSSLPTGTSTIAFVLLIVSPSFIFLSSPKIQHQRYHFPSLALPLEPSSNSTISLLERCLIRIHAQFHPQLIKLFQFLKPRLFHQNFYLIFK